MANRAVYTDLNNARSRTYFVRNWQESRRTYGVRTHLVTAGYDTAADLAIRKTAPLDLQWPNTKVPLLTTTTIKLDGGQAYLIDRYGYRQHRVHTEPSAGTFYTVEPGTVMEDWYPIDSRAPLQNGKIALPTSENTKVYPMSGLPVPDMSPPEGRRPSDAKGKSRRTFNVITISFPFSIRKNPWTVAGVKGMMNTVNAQSNLIIAGEFHVPNAFQALFRVGRFNKTTDPDGKKVRWNGHWIFVIRDGYWERMQYSDETIAVGKETTNYYRVLSHPPHQFRAMLPVYDK